MRSESAAEDRTAPGRPVWAALAGAAILAALALYAPALQGDFVSDDVNYVVQNPTIQPLDGGRLVDIWSPWGSAARYIANYAPVQMSIVAVQRAVLGDAPLGYHVLNVVMHALASVLLASLCLQIGISRGLAAAVGLAFLVHPANVEAVAWVSQLKTNGALAASLLALHLHRTRPFAGAAAFAVALGFKATALAALAAAVAGELTALRAGHGADPMQRSRWTALGAWMALGLAYAGIQLASFQAANATVAPGSADPVLRAASIVAHLGRYVAMSLGIGLGTLQQPDPLSTIADPWVALGTAASAFVLFRIVRSARRASPEFAAWIFAVVSWAPSSQIFPFIYPVADRYLYFVLAGALPALALAAAPFALDPWASAGKRNGASRTRALVASAVVAGLLVAFAVQAHGRARIWRASAFVLADSARKYPRGLTARVLEARRAAALGDAEATSVALRQAMDRGFDGLSQLLQDPAFRNVVEHPSVEPLVHELARDWIAHFRAEAEPTQQSLVSLAHAHFVVGELDESIAALERARDRGGSLDGEIERRLEEVRRVAPR